MVANEYELTAAGLASGSGKPGLAADRFYGHLNRHEARRLAHAQAEHLWREQHGRW